MSGPVRFRQASLPKRHYIPSMADESMTDPVQWRHHRQRQRAPRYAHVRRRSTTARPPRMRLSQTGSGSSSGPPTGSGSRPSGSACPPSSLLQRALDAVRADDKIRIEHFAIRESDTWPLRDGRIGLDGANGGAEADTYAGCGAREAMEHRLVIHAMDVTVWRAMIARHARAPACVPYCWDQAN